MILTIMCGIMMAVAATAKENLSYKKKIAQFLVYLMPIFLILRLEVPIFSMWLRCNLANYEMVFFFLIYIGTWAQVPQSLWTCRKGNLPVLLWNKRNFLWPVILQATAWKLRKKVGNTFLSISFFMKKYGTVSKMFHWVVIQSVPLLRIY